MYFVNSPSNERRPQAIQMMKLMPTDPVLTSNPLGDTKIPDPFLIKIVLNQQINEFLKLEKKNLPIIVPTIKATPLNNPNRFSS
jgi:hypothetical protein